MNINISTKGFVEAINILRQGVIKPARDIIMQIANQIETKAKRNFNVKPFSDLYTRTGKLQQSIINDQIDDQGLVRRVFVGVMYGHFIEEGTGIYAGKKPWFGKIPRLGYRKIKGMKPYPFFGPAIEDTKGDIPDIGNRVILDYISNPSKS